MDSDDDRIARCFTWAIWDYVLSDLKSGLYAKLRMSMEGIVSLAIGWIVLAEFGSADAAFDFGLEKALVVPIALIVMMLMHGLWSWATAPRAIYKHQQAELRDARAESKRLKAEVSSLDAQLVSHRTQQSAIDEALDKLKPPEYPSSDPSKQAKWRREWDAWVQAAKGTLQALFGKRIVNEFCEAIDEVPEEYCCAVARSYLRALRAVVE